MASDASAYAGRVAIPDDVRTAAQLVMPDVASIHVELLEGGSSAFVARLELESPAGGQRSVVFRQHADRAVKEHTSLVASKEFHLTRALAQAGFEVAHPLALHPHVTSCGPWLVTEWVEGSTVVSEAEVDNALAQMAHFLARLHAVDITSLDGVGLAEIEDPVEALPGHLANDEIGVVVRGALDEGVRRRPNASVLLHGDFWPGNVMFERGRLVAVLDWEDAQLGDPLVDLACARVEVTCAYGHDACDLFTAEYLDCARRLTSELDQHDLALWDVYVAATALSAMHRWGLFSSGWVLHTG